MGMFDKFNLNMNEDEVRKQVEEASKNVNYTEVPKGTYTGYIEKMELGATKDKRPMFKVQFRITEGEFAKKCLFMNRVVAGTKNDMNMISSVEGWVNKLEPEVPLAFNGNYDDFAEQIMDIMEEIDGTVECEIDYDEKSFNSISITDIWDK